VDSDIPDSIARRPRQEIGAPAGPEDRHGGQRKAAQANRAAVAVLSRLAVAFRRRSLPTPSRCSLSKPSLSRSASVGEGGHLAGGHRPSGLESLPALVMGNGRPT